MTDEATDGGGIATQKRRRLGWNEIISLLFNGLTFAAALSAVIALLIATQQLQASASQDIHDQFQELNSIFLEHENWRMHPYFHEGKEITPDHDLYQGALSMVDLHLSFFDVYLSQLPFTAFDDKEKKSWENYISTMFKRSPIMCQHLKETMCSYTSDLIQFGTNSCPQGTITLQDYELECR